MVTSIAEFMDSDMMSDALDLSAFHGFSGLHGGLSAAMLLREMRQHAPSGSRLARMTANFLRPADGPLLLSSELVKAGSKASIVKGSAISGAELAIEATSIFVLASRTGAAPLTPSMPDTIVGRSDAQLFEIPAEFVPISQRMEIRPATDTLPYSGSDTPELCAWIRLKDSLANNDERVLLLADALAPSFSAVLSELRMVPTVAMSATMSEQVPAVDFDWVLVRARTTMAGRDGWVREVIDVWTEDGVHLITSDQLRVVR
ncbi:thioesterase family protein [Rhodococcus sp. ABRD24]|uniref:thioesterase family protein n=1 Tax=Rhodococcus sp. ABRD24 TaxID=2507582 RepID=UPI00103A6692|nr:thioesterase family protein [Rhodococcus sp. ABRD24]QBJ98117.1 thioesterase family protein [Rhodococcus sp. ABRD24]